MGWVGLGTSSSRPKKVHNGPKVHKGPLVQLGPKGSHQMKFNEQ